MLQVVQAKTPSLINEIFDAFEKLQLRSKYLHTIRKRWMKRNVNKREHLLLEAWPGMAPQHRPDFDVILQNLKGPQYRDALLLPYINLEDLSSPYNLLDMITSRSARGPEHFAWSDPLSLKTAVSMEAVEPNCHFRSVMLLTGQNTRSAYGKLEYLEDQKDVENILWTGFAIPLNHGLVVLEVQKKVYRFLVRCIEILLPDIDFTIPNMLQYLDQDQTSKARIGSSSSKELLSVAELNMHAAYHLPTLVDITSLRKLASTQRDQAEDRYWALRADPSVFLSQLEVYAEQAQKPWLKAIRLKVFSTPQSLEKNALKKACMNVIQRHCWELRIWQEIEDELIKIEATRMQIDDELPLSKRLPRLYESVLERLIALGMVTWHHAIFDFRTILTSCSGFLDYHKVVVPEKEGWADFELDKSTKAYWPPVLRLLVDLCGPKETNLLGCMNILDEIERQMTLDPKQRIMLDSVATAQLSNLAALAQIRDAIAHHQPTIQAGLDAEDFVGEITKRFKPMVNLQDFLATIPLNAHAEPRTAFVYPVGRKRTACHVEQMRIAEKKLDKYWSWVDEQFVARCGQTLQTYAGLRRESRVIERTREWDPAEEQLRQKPPKALASQDYCFPTEQSLPNTERISTGLKTKEKTRGQPNLKQESSISQPTAASQKVPARMFSLSRRAYKTVATLIPSTNGDRTTRQIIWKDFLHMMYELDFSIQKRHGSEWYFEPVWQRSMLITIHEPHPAREMRFDKIRFEANRLARKYGWTSRSFLVKTGGIVEQ